MIMNPTTCIAAAMHVLVVELILLTNHLPFACHIITKWSILKVYKL